MASLYLHIPFCERKCLYCDFYSVEDRALMPQFLSALSRETAMYADHGELDTFETIFFGGGTPSLLTPQQMESILLVLESTFSIQKGAEITVETNPGTVSAEKLAAFRSLGINRLSIGVQSFRDEDLQFLGRIHNRAQAIECVQLARKALFENVSLDLIYSIPGQTRGQWEENLRQALSLGPDHISAYSLIIEDDTPLERMVSSGQVSPNPVEKEAELYELTMQFLQVHGFEHYEVSNYARPGFRSRHNCNYWNHQNYLGLGPSAHSFWKKPEEGRGRRWWNVSSVSMYCNRLMSGISSVLAEEVVQRDDLIRERMFLGLRSDGLKIDTLRSDFGFELLPRQNDLIRSLVDAELAYVDQETLRLTQKGYLVCDEICARLML